MTAPNPGQRDSAAFVGWGDNGPIMKKTFKLNVEGKHPDRVLEAVKHEIRKYVKRQRRVPLPEGVDFWDFDCRFGAAEDNAEAAHFATITALIDGVAKDKGDSFYLELLAKNGVRKVKDSKVSDAVDATKLADPVDPADAAVKAKQV